MRKLTLTIVILLLTKAIYADGIIPNLQQYLERYPQHIDAQGWVTISRSELLDNTKNFDVKCQYQLVYSDTIIEMPTSVRADFLIFNYTNPNVYMLIESKNKLLLLTCPEGTRKKTDTGARIIAIKQLSPESTKYALEKHLRTSLRASPAEFVDLMVSMDRRIKTLEKEVNKSCCKKNCVIL